MTIEYKSEDGLSNLEMCAYFWNEKRDMHRYVGWDTEINKRPVLQSIWDDYNREVKAAESKLETRMQELIDEHDPEE